ncbi:MAG: radical SAM family heme chaperone HemW [Candidatus Acidiferrales bacterium]|jgi:oxygen-independent coproporphyrinogen-3 oxidase
MTSGLYIQVPFCQTKCTYCNFHTGVFSPNLYAPYAAAITREIELRSSEIWPAFDTVYIGGGTPSLLFPANLKAILDSLRAHFKCAIEEATLEADPETITREKASAWLAAGFNRISLGAQSFSDVELKAAGRMHRRADTFAAVEILRESGFRNITLDLIAGMPHQTAATWRDSIESLLRTNPEHVSIYLMEIDEGSHLGKEVLAGGQRYSAGALPTDDEMASFYEHACERLAAEGFEHYEISNWAKPGFRSRHNLKYWHREPYLGLGAGAHSFDGTRRWANSHDPAAYVSAIDRGLLPVEQNEAVTRLQAHEEEIFLGLRLLDGVDISILCGQSGSVILERIEELRAQGLLIVENGRVRLAPDRVAISNEVFVALLEAVSA